LTNTKGVYVTHDSDFYALEARIAKALKLMSAIVVVLHETADAVGTSFSVTDTFLIAGEALAGLSGPLAPGSDESEAYKQLLEAAGIESASETTWLRAQALTTAAAAGAAAAEHEADQATQNGLADLLATVFK
jgi:hypothetical protein